MRISDWRSDVCSSDLSSKLTIGARSACRCALSTRKPVRNWKIRVRPANRVNRAAIVVRAVKAAVAIAVVVAADAAVLRAGNVVNGAKAARMAATLACRTSLLRKTKFRPKGGQRKGDTLRDGPKGGG